jgi:diacylglycerol kinase family enzyme
MSQKKPDSATTCLINPKAANDRWIRSRKLRKALERKLPGQYFDLRGDRTDTVQMAKESCGDSRMIVAIGGDGTIADVLQGIFESGREDEVVLGIIPFGSGNAFRKTYGIPKNPGKAVDVLARGKVVRSDVMEVEGRYAGFASVGATAGVTQEKLRHPVQGLLGHLLAVWKMFKLPLEEKEVELIDGVDDRGRHFARKTFKSRFFDCIVAKTNFFGYSWRVAPKADVQDGYLDITLVETGPAEYLLNFAWLYLGLFQRTQRHFKARKLIIRGKALPVQYNGEVLGELDEVTFRVLPRSLRIVINK